MEWNMESHPTYLWTLPMFHCNGWCFPWTIAAKAGINICLRKVTSDSMYSAISKNKVNYMCGAPIVLGMLIDSEFKDKITIEDISFDANKWIILELNELSCFLVFFYF